MVVYHSSGVISKLVKYIKKYYPKVLLIVRPRDNMRNRDRGYMSGQPDILILEQKCRYMGLAMWTTSGIEMSRYSTKFLRRLVRNSFETMVSDDFDDLRLCFDIYMAKCGDRYRVDRHQISLIKVINSSKAIRKYSPRTSLEDDNLRHIVKHVKDNYPSAVLIPGLGDDGQPNLIIISPNILHNGLAIWFRHTSICYDFSKLNCDQFGLLKRMALRSYVTISSTDYCDLPWFIDNYMRDEYEYDHERPTYPEELCQ